MSALVGALSGAPDGDRMGRPVSRWDANVLPIGRRRHKLPTGFRLVKTSLLGRLHHEYCLVKEAA